MLKLPKRTNNIEIFCDFNILEFYHSVLEGKKISLKKSKKKYLIVRKDEKWIDHNDWAKKVVWFANKKGAYLYDCLVTENKKTIKSKRNKVIRIESEPFGSDARYQ